MTYSPKGLGSKVIVYMQPLPADVQPVFSMAMHGVVACFTLTGNKETRVSRDVCCNLAHVLRSGCGLGHAQEKLTQLVQLMGGRVEGDLTKRVSERFHWLQASCDYFGPLPPYCQATHLIAGQVGSQKYHVARQSHLPVLLPSWVESCWEESLNGGVVSATDEAVLSKHRCLPFTGCTISVTGLDEGTRGRVKEACQENGGRYLGELTKDVCTHLIVGSKTSERLSLSPLYLLSLPLPLSLSLSLLPLSSPSLSKHFTSLSLLRSQVPLCPAVGDALCGAPVVPGQSPGKVLHA